MPLAPSRIKIHCAVPTGQGCQPSLWFCRKLQGPSAPIQQEADLTSLDVACHRLAFALAEIHLLGRSQLDPRALVGTKREQP